MNIGTGTTLGLGLALNTLGWKVLYPIIGPLLGGNGTTGTGTTGGLIWGWWCLGGGTIGAIIIGLALRLSPSWTSCSYPSHWQHSSSPATSSCW